MCKKEKQKQPPKTLYYGEDGLTLNYEDVNHIQRINAYCPLNKGPCRNYPCIFCMLDGKGKRNICMIQQLIVIEYMKNSGDTENDHKK